MGSVLHVVALVIRRDLRLALRRRADLANTLVFFVIVASLFPFGVGPEVNLLRAVGPGVMWVAALLASMLALDRIFAADYADGTLEQLLLTPEPLAALVAGKVFAHWLITGLPLALISPLLALQFGLPGNAIITLVVSLALGTPVLSLIGAVGAALTLGVRGAGVLTALLVLPLYIPVLILGAGAVDAAAAGMDASAHLMLLGALLTFGSAFAPWPVATALRVSVE
jgi:heme exporter protein B